MAATTRWSPIHRFSKSRTEEVFDAARPSLMPPPVIQQRLRRRAPRGGRRGDDENRQSESPARRKGEARPIVRVLFGAICPLVDDIGGAGPDDSVFFDRKASHRQGGRHCLYLFEAFEETKLEYVRNTPTTPSLCALSFDCRLCCAGSLETDDNE